jgi:hypothetical protein
MLTLQRLFVCALTALALFLGGHLVYAMTLGCKNPDSSANVVHRYLETLREREEIEARQEKKVARRTMMQVIAHDVISRQVTIAEAIEQYRGLFPDGVDPLMPGRTDNERLGRCLMHWVQNELQDSGSQGSTLLREFEAELTRHLQTVEAEHPTTSTVH